MKLSDKILEQYKECQDLLFHYKERLDEETRDVRLKVYKKLIIEREGELSVVTQAYKDALFMEDALSKLEGNSQ